MQIRIEHLDVMGQADEYVASGAGSDAADWAVKRDATFGLAGLVERQYLPICSNVDAAIRSDRDPSRARRLCVEPRDDLVCGLSGFLGANVLRRQTADGSGDSQRTSALGAIGQKPAA